VTPDRYRVERDSGAVAARVADKQAAANHAEELTPLPPERRTARVLRDDEARAVAALVAAAEHGLSARVDIEFCFARGKLWALQCRPITTLR
jgi:pyruvate,water dikinase